MNKRNKTIALVTGSNRGIGFATVKELLKLGHTVILTSRNEKDGQKAASELEKYGLVIYFCSGLVECSFYYIRDF